MKQPIGNVVTRAGEQTGAVLTARIEGGKEVAIREVPSLEGCRYELSMHQGDQALGDKQSFDNLSDFWQALAASPAADLTIRDFVVAYNGGGTT